MKKDSLSLERFINFQIYLHVLLLTIHCIELALLNRSFRKDTSDLLFSLSITKIKMINFRVFKLKTKKILRHTQSFASSAASWTGKHYPCGSLEWRLVSRS